jgi:hypothetical protein
MGTEPWKDSQDDEPPSLLERLFGPRVQLSEEERATFKRELDELKAKGDMLGALLPAYRPSHACVKCGHGVAATRWCRGEARVPVPVPNCYAQTGEHEHLHRTCERCGYVWYEKPLSTEVC